jgi:septal ring factor EnvC (AmiA/AmiB activator)
MGGQSQSFEEIIEQTVIGNGSERPETLYIEIRNENIPQDPLLWFGQGKDLKK